MGRIALTSGFTVIPEGEYVFGIYDVTYDEDFGKIEVKMVTANGMRHSERFSLTNDNGEPNEKALNAFSFFAKTALNRNDVNEIDHTDLIGHYIRARIVHTVQPNRKDPTKTVTFANLDRDKIAADGFDEKPTDAVLALMKQPQKPAAPAQKAENYDLDSLLG